MTAHERARHDSADVAPAVPSPLAAARVVLGLLLVLAGPVVLAVGAVPQLISTFGPDPFTFLIQDRARPPVGGNDVLLTLGVLVLPAGGFSLAYLSARSKTRQWISAFCTVFFTVQAGLLAAAVLWITGVGYDAAALFALPHSFDTGVPITPIAMLFSVAAAAIMHTLGRRTTFDAESADYFAEGNTVVRVRPLPVALHALWAAVAVGATAAAVYLPLLLAERAAAGADRGILPHGTLGAWPRYTDYGFAEARAAYAVTLGILAGAVISSLIKKVLYRTILRSYIGATAPQESENRWKTLQAVAHYPIAVAGATGTAIALFLLPFGHSDSSPDTAVVIFSVATGALVLLGLFMLASVWRSGDDPIYDSALQRGELGDLQKTFAAPARRRRGPKRPKRPRQNH